MNKRNVLLIVAAILIGLLLGAANNNARQARKAAVQRNTAVNAVRSVTFPLSALNSGAPANPTNSVAQ